MKKNIKSSNQIQNNLKKVQTSTSIEQNKWILFFAKEWIIILSLYLFSYFIIFLTQKSSNNFSDFLNNIFSPFTNIETYKIFFLIFMISLFVRATIKAINVIKNHEKNLNFNKKD